jgi:hypothetical protein
MVPAAVRRDEYRREISRARSQDEVSPRHPQTARKSPRLEHSALEREAASSDARAVIAQEANDVMKPSRKDGFETSGWEAFAHVWNNVSPQPLWGVTFNVREDQIGKGRMRARLAVAA